MPQGQVSDIMKKKVYRLLLEKKLLFLQKNWEELMYDDYDDYLDELDDELDSYQDEIDDYDDELSRLEDEESFLDVMYGMQTDEDDKTYYDIRKAHLRDEKDHIRYMRDMAKSDRDNVRHEREIAPKRHPRRESRTFILYSPRFHLVGNP